MRANSTGFPQLLRALRSSTLCLLILALLNLIVYEPVRHNGFVWDDQANLVQNDPWRGISPGHLRWMFTTFHGGHYHPLTWLSFAIDYHLWGGANAFGIHCTNVVLHILGSILFWIVGRQFMALVYGDQYEWINVAALIAALIYSLHPLRVESVAWATERRDVLSSALLLLSVHYYLRAAQSTSSMLRTSAFWVSVGFYICSLLAKASGITAPLVLMMLDWFPLRRHTRISQPATRIILLEKLFFLVPAALIGGCALAAQHSSGAMWSVMDLPISLRMMRSFFGLAFYPAKTLWPAGLSPLYEQVPTETGLEWEYIVSAAVVTAITFGAVFWRRKAPAIALAWFAYVLLVSPVLGLAQSGPQLVADRYSYLSGIPLAMLVGSGLSFLARRNAQAAKMAIVVLACVCCVYVIAARRQVSVWKDELTLWKYVVDVRPNTGLGHSNLAIELNKNGDYSGAMQHAQRALSILPGNLAAHKAMGQAALALGEYETAIQPLRVAIDMQSQMSRPEPALHAALGGALAGAGNLAGAERELRRAIALEPTSERWIVDLAGVLARSGRSEEGVALLREQIAEGRGGPTTYLRLAGIYKQRGDHRRAADAYNEGIARFPDDVSLRSSLAWLLATSYDDSVRDEAKAIALAEQAIKDSGGQSLHAVEALAAAKAGAGEFAEAAGLLEQALSRTDMPISERLRSRLTSARESYLRGEAIRE